MAGKNEWEAADNFVAYLHETLSCITPEKLAFYQQSKKLYKVWFNPPAELTTRSGGRLFLSFTQVLGAGPDPKEPSEFKVSTREYSYRLLERSNIASKEILAYHWHPHDSDLRDPHLHIGRVPRVSLSYFPRVCGRYRLYAYQVLRRTANNEALRVDGHHRKKQTSVRENGHVENSTPIIALWKSH